MVHGRVRRRLAPALCAAALLVVGQPAVATQQVAATAVTGSAFGYHADNISLFGGAQPDTGPTPVVQLAPDASNSPQAAPAATGRVGYGPATLFTSDAIIVTTGGALGPAEVVTSATSLSNINKALTQPTSGSEVFTADSVHSSCTASGTSTSGSTTVLNGTLRVHAQAEDHDEGVVAIPTSPPPNYTVAGHVHLGTHTDYFVVVFNEHVHNPDGSLTVNAVHEYFGATLDAQGTIVDEPSSILQGDLYLGQTVCGLLP